MQKHYTFLQTTCHNQHLPCDVHSNLPPVPSTLPSLWKCNNRLFDEDQIGFDLVAQYVPICLPSFLFPLYTFIQSNPQKASMFISVNMRRIICKYICEILVTSLDTDWQFSKLAMVLNGKIYFIVTVITIFVFVSASLSLVAKKYSHL